MRFVTGRISIIAVAQYLAISLGNTGKEAVGVGVANSKSARSCLYLGAEVGLGCFSRETCDDNFPSTLHQNLTEELI